MASLKVLIKIQVVRSVLELSEDVVDRNWEAYLCKRRSNR